ncbi:MAG: LON peptidase substrate-binding domain-containing protein [Myxococcota bacterium]
MLDDDATPGSEVLEALPVFPLPNAVLLPGMILPLNVFEPRYLALVDHVLQGGKHIGVPLLRPGFDSAFDGSPELEPVFGIGRVVSHRPLPDGRRFIRLEGLGRVRARQELPARAEFRELSVEALPEIAPADSHQLEVLRAQLERICTTLEVDDRRMVASVLEIADARVMLYAIAAIMPTLGYATQAEVRGGSRAPLLELQQQCLDAETADARVECLIGGAADICARLADSGSWPRQAWN